MIRVVVEKWADGSLDLDSVQFYSVVPEIYFATTMAGDIIPRNDVSGLTLHMRLHADGLAYIRGVWTREFYRKQGHATRVMEAALEYARQEHIETVTLGVQGGEDNVAAVRLYTKFGFVFNPDQYHNVWMTLRLS